MKGSSLIKSTFGRLVILLAFFALPLLNIFRIDLSSFHFFVLGNKFGFNKGYILLVTVLILVYTFVSISKWFGRQFCGWLCPHNKFIMFLNNLGNSKLLKNNKALRLTVEYAIITVCSPIISFGFISYFYDPTKLLNDILSFDITRYSVIAMVVYTGFFFVMLNRKIRYNYCRNNCPYGILQMAIQDKFSRTGTQGIKNMFRGTGMILTFIMLLLVGVVTFGLVTNTGYATSILKQEQGREVGNYISYNFKLSIENLENKPVTYKITYKDIPSTWVTQLPSEMKVNANETLSTEISFKADPSSYNKNQIITVQFINERGKVAERTIPIFPFKRF